MQDSIFTRIIKGEIPSHKVYEDELTYAFLDIHPSVPGHTLVVPKRQVEFLWDLPDQDYQAVMATAKKLALRMRAALDVGYVGVKVVGEEVPHAHVHLVPFNSLQEYLALPSSGSEPDHQMLAEMASKLAA